MLAAMRTRAAAAAAQAMRQPRWVAKAASTAGSAASSSSVTPAPALTAADTASSSDGDTSGGRSMYEDPELYDEVFGYRDFEAEAAFIRAAYKRHSAPTGRPLESAVELGCGPARHSALLAKGGARVWALDASETMAQYARRMVRDAGVGVEVLLGDMTDFQIEGMESRLDLAMCLLGTFSHATTNDKALATLRQVARHLRPGGLLLLELAHPGDLFDGTLLLGDEGGEMWEAESGRLGCKLLVEWGAPGDPFDISSQVLTRTVVVSRVEDEAAGPVLHESVVEQRAFTLQEVDLLGHAAGLRLEAAYGDLNLAVGLQHEDAYRLVACLVKPGGDAP